MVWFFVLLKRSHWKKHDELLRQDALRLKDRLTSQEFHNNSKISLAHVFLRYEVSGHGQLQPLLPFNL